MDKHQYLTDFHKFQQNREKYWAPKFFAALRVQYQQFIHATGSTQSRLMSISPEPVRRVLKPLYIDAGVTYGAKVYASLPKKPRKALFKARMPIGFNEEMTAIINQYFETGWLDTSEQITDTTRELIQRVMTQAENEGRSLEWIVNELEHESVDISRNRSRLIARTETVTAANQAGFFAAAKTGLLQQKEWLAANDNRTRPDHVNVSGSRVGMEDYFTVGDSRMLLPGARVQENGLPTPAEEVCNCRCVCLYISQRNAAGRLIEHDYGVWNMVGV